MTHRDFVSSVWNITDLFQVCVCAYAQWPQELVYFSLLQLIGWTVRETGWRGGQTWQWVCELVCQMSSGMPQRANHNHTAEINEVKSNQPRHTNRDMHTHTWIQTRTLTFVYAHAQEHIVVLAQIHWTLFSWGSDMWSDLMINWISSCVNICTYICCYYQSSFLIACLTCAQPLWKSFLPFFFKTNTHYTIKELLWLLSLHYTVKCWLGALLWNFWWD